MKRIALIFLIFFLYLLIPVSLQAVEVEKEPWHEIPQGFPSAEAETLLVSGGTEGQAQFYKEIVIDPYGTEENPVALGNLQVISAWTKSPAGITKVTATISGSGILGEDIKFFFEMQMVEGTTQESRWIGSWKVRNVSNAYFINITAVDSAGTTTTISPCCLAVFTPPFTTNTPTPSDPPSSTVPPSTVPPSIATQAINFPVLAAIAGGLILFFTFFILNKMRRKSPQ